MRIGIEAQRIFRKKKHGMDIVAVELIRNLQQIDRENEYYIFLKDDEDNQVIHETENFKIIKIQGGPYPYWEQVLLPRQMKKYGIQLLHCTSNTAPLNISIPLVVTVHDIIYLEKWNFSKGTAYQIVGNLYRRWNVPHAVKKASRVITVSNFEQKRIQEYFDLRDEKVMTVYNGVSEHFKKVDNPDVLQSIKKKYALPEKFIFYLGNTDPKKNMEGVMRALSIIRKRNKLTFKLLMLDIEKNYLEKIAHEIEDLEILNSISFCGYVPNKELPAVYSLADIFLYPSLRESFGIPILEAMACEVPVITSDTSSMPEVAGDAAFYIDPYSPESVAEGIINLMEDLDIQEKLSLAGKNQIKNFTWRNNSVQTLQIYKSVMGEGSL
jgi:glycosyltransferase involved in cell wall biosynthesis